MDWDDDASETATSQAAVVVKRDPVPWALFIVTAIVFAVTTALLLMRASTAQTQANDAYVEKKRAQSQVEALTPKLDAQTKRADDLESQVRAVSAERDALRSEVEELRSKVRADDDPPRVKATAKKVAKKKPSKKKKKKRRR